MSVDHHLTPERVRADLSLLAAADSDIAAAAAAVGSLPDRRVEPGFRSLVRISIGQQLSIHAAARIFDRLEVELGGTVTAEALLRASDDALATAGVSRPKRAHLQDAARAVTRGLDLAALADASDADARAAIESLRGFGPWSADMYLMSALGRPDVWPVGDLAVREGFARIKRLPARPTPRELLPLGEPFRPRRSTLALLCWQYYLDVPAPRAR